MPTASSSITSPTNTPVGTEPTMASPRTWTTSTRSVPSHLSRSSASDRSLFASQFFPISASGKSPIDQKGPRSPSPVRSVMFARRSKPELNILLDLLS